MAGDLQPVCHWVINILFIIGEGSTLARLYSRSVLTKTFGLDDWAMVATLFFNAGQHVILYMFLNYGGGKTESAVLAEDPENLYRLLKVLFTEEIWYIFLHFWIKLCFLLFYLRLSSAPSFRRSVYVVMAMNALNTIGIWLIYCLQCRPLAAFWDPTAHPDAKCLPSKVTYFVPGSMELLLDCIIFILPIATIWNLQMSLKRRLGVIAVITTGGAAALVSAFRLIIVDQFATNPDFTYILGRMVLISAVEIEVAIFAVNMPGLKALWSLATKGKLGSSRYNQASSYIADPSKRSNAHALSNLWNKRHQIDPTVDDLKTNVEDGNSTRHLTQRGSDDDMNRNGNIKSGQIIVSNEYSISEDYGDSSITTNSPFTYAANKSKGYQNIH